MKKKKLTDMDVANVTVSVEANTGDLESELQFDTLPDGSPADALIEVERTQAALSELADRADTVREQSALEAYQWAYKALTGINQVVDNKAISLEGFTGTITRKNELAKAIRAEVSKLDVELNAALETYASDIKDDFSEIIKQYDQLNRKLRATDSEIENEVKTKIEINHTRIFEMFMVKDVFKGEDPIAAIRAETTNLERLVSRVGTGVDRITKDVGKLGDDDKLERSGRDLPDQQSMYLMFNRRVKIDGGQFEPDQRKTRNPRKSYSWLQHAAMIFGAIIFREAGYNLVKNFQTKKDSEAKVTNNLGEIHKFIRAVEALEDVVDDLSSHVQDLVDLFKKVNESQESALNRRIVPVMELAMFVMKQVCDITKGTDTLFTKIVRKHTN